MMLYVLPHVAGRTWRLCHAEVKIAMRHTPRWFGVLLGIILAVPLGFDDLIALVLIAGFLVVKPTMRREMRAALRTW